jgi:hypothetical protein
MEVTMPDGSRDAKDAWITQLARCEPDALQGENDLQLGFEEKALDDRLARPECYAGREDDEARKTAIGAERNRRQAEAKVRARLDGLIADTKRELGELSADVGALDQGVNGKMIADYQALRQELGDQLAAAEAARQANQALPEMVLQSWEEALYEIGDLRKVLVSNLNVDADKKIKETERHLKEYAGDLKKLKASAERIEDAVKEIEDGEKWVSRLLTLNDAIEMLEGSVEAMAEASEAYLAGKVVAYAKLTKEGYTIATTSTVIEQGIKNLVDYNITLAVAGEGFSSIDELQRAMASKTELIQRTAGELQRLLAQKQHYDAQYTEPRKGKMRQ